MLSIEPPLDSTNVRYRRAKAVVDTLGVNLVDVVVVGSIYEVAAGGYSHIVHPDVDFFMATQNLGRCCLDVDLLCHVDYRCAVAVACLFDSRHRSTGRIVYGIWEFDPRLMLGETSDERTRPNPDPPPVTSTALPVIDAGAANVPLPTPQLAAHHTNRLRWGGFSRATVNISNERWKGW